jgi:hypothetical protein
MLWVMPAVFMFAGFIVMPDGPWYRTIGAAILISWANQIAEACAGSGKHGTGGATP